MGIRNEIHSGVFHLHAMKAASPSEDYVFVDGEEGIISEATACWCGKSLFPKFRIEKQNKHAGINPLLFLWGFFALALSAARWKDRFS